METDLCDSLGFGFVEHSLEVRDIAVDIAVGKESDEMKRAAVLCLCNDFLPGFAFEHFPGGDCFGDQFRALSENASASHCVVSDFTVAHVVVAGQSDRRSVRLECSERELFHELVEERCRRIKNRIAFFVFADADAVHDHQDNRAASFLEFRIGLEFFKHDIFPFLFKNIQTSKLHSCAVIFKKKRAIFRKK